MCILLDVFTRCREHHRPDSPQDFGNHIVQCPSGGVVIAALADALSHLSRDAALRQRLSKGARRRAGDFAWPVVVGRLYEPADRRR